MPAYVKVRLTESNGGTDMYINPALVLNLVAGTDPDTSIILLTENKAYIVEGKVPDVAKLLSY